MTLAPSEKHLEDWIVAHQDYALYGIGKVIARQPRFANGRPDLIAQYPYCMTVIELKKGEITTETVAQTLRYMHDLDFMFRHLYSFNISNLDYQYANSESFGVQPAAPEILGSIVGHSIEDPYVPLLCNLLQINIVLYEFDGASYWLRNHDFQMPRRSEEALLDWCQGSIGEAMLEVMKNRSALQRSMKDAQS